MHIQNSANANPSELTWLLNEIGMLTARLNDLLTEANDRMELAGHLGQTNQENYSTQESESLERTGFEGTTRQEDLKPDDE